MFIISYLNRHCENLVTQFWPTTDFLILWKAHKISYNFISEFAIPPELFSKIFKCWKCQLTNFNMNLHLKIGPFYGIQELSQKYTWLGLGFIEPLYNIYILCHFDMCIRHMYEEIGFVNICLAFKVMYVLLLKGLIRFKIILILTLKQQEAKLKLHIYARIRIMWIAKFDIRFP